MVRNGTALGDRRTHRLTIVDGQSTRVAEWMLSRLPEVVELPGGYEAIGIVRDDELIAGLLYTNWIECEGGGNIHMWAVGEPGWMSKRTVAAMFGYPFVQLGCHRMTVTIDKRNKIARHIVEKLGFKLEGVIREGLAPGKDMTVYGLLRDECRWSLST